MIVARILARIEAIKTPAPAAAAPAPQVTRADVQTIQRLVNEFRAELAALGVRVTAVEEELTAIKGATSATKASGDMYYRYVMPASVGGIGGAGSWSQALLTFTGKASDATAVVRLAVGTDGEGADFGASSSTGWIEPVSFVRAYLDLGYYGLICRAGRSGRTTSARSSMPAARQTTGGLPISVAISSPGSTWRESTLPSPHPPVRP